jgi:hypothetical protein
VVGVTLEVDQATLHKPEICRILLGIRDIDNLHDSDAGVLGDFFYIFSYEIESVVFQGPPVVRNVVTVTNTFTPPSPKCAYSTMSAASADGYASTDQSIGTSYGRTRGHVLETVSEHESEEESKYDSKLLIDSIARENRDKHAKMDKEEPVVVNTGVDTSIAVEKGLVNVMAPVTPVVEKESISPDNGRPSKQLIPSYVAAVMGPTWLAAPVVTEVGMNEAIGGEENAAYFVQSPSPTSAEKEDLPPVEKMVPPVGDMRDNLRDPIGKMGSVVEQAAALSKKRNLEGTSSSLPSFNSFDVLSNNEIMERAALMGIDIPSDNFEKIDVVRELEKARCNLSNKNDNISSSSFVVHHDHGRQTPLSLMWLDSDEIDEPFTVVSSRKYRRKASRKPIPLSRPMTRNHVKDDISAPLPGRPIWSKKKPDRFKLLLVFGILGGQVRKVSLPVSRILWLITSWILLGCKKP